MMKDTVLDILVDLTGSEEVKQDLEEFKQDMPLLALEIEKITRARNRTAVNVLGGKDSNAYKNRSLRLCCPAKS